jgi:hypothetical protein
MSGRGKGVKKMRAAVPKKKVVVKKQGLNPIQSSFAKEVATRQMKARRIFAMSRVRKVANGQLGDNAGSESGGKSHGTNFTIKASASPYLNMEIDGSLRRIVREAMTHTKKTVSSTGKRIRIRFDPGVLAYACLTLGCLPQAIVPRAYIPGELDASEETHLLEAYKKMMT